MRISPVIYGCKGPVLSDDERSFFSDVSPWGFIIFGRNVENPDQLRKLVDDLKQSAGHDDVAILIDQEGGRVRRLRPPYWSEYHSGELIAHQYNSDPVKGKRLAWLQSRLMAADLRALGINVDCLPVLDVPTKDAHDVIGDRAYGSDPETIAMLGGEASRGLLDGGVVPVIKHIPGHGRARDDSHKALPRVDASFDELKKTDFLPFKKLSNMPAAMTAHVVYSQVDAKFPATTSKTVIDKIIRNEIGFDGLLMCDDLAMHALSGDFAQRTESSFAAGCDVVLHCSAAMDEMLAIANALSDFRPESWRRAKNTARVWEKIADIHEEELRREFAALVEGKEYKLDPTES